MTSYFANFKKMFGLQIVFIKHSAFRWFSSHSSFTLWPAVTYLCFCIYDTWIYETVYL